jgi:hypothetical protein
MLSPAEARLGLLIHAVITAVVWAILIPINVLVAPEFPWSVFVVAGMSIGLLIHYLFGVRWLGRTVEARQRKVERWAAELKSA